MRDRVKRIQAVLLKLLSKPAVLMMLSHDERAAVADLAALLGELVDRVENLRKDLNP